METSVIKRIIGDKGYGFITCDTGARDVFFHAQGVIGVFEELQEGDAVQFERKQNEKGEHATAVRRVK